MKKTLLASLAVLAIGFSTSFAQQTAISANATGNVLINVVPVFKVESTNTVDLGNATRNETVTAPAGTALTFDITGIDGMVLTSSGLVADPANPTDVTINLTTAVDPAATMVLTAAAPAVTWSFPVASAVVDAAAILEAKTFKYKLTVDTSY